MGKKALDDGECYDANDCNCNPLSSVAIGTDKIRRNMTFEALVKRCLSIVDRFKLHYRPDSYIRRTVGRPVLQTLFPPQGHSQR